MRRLSFAIVVATLFAMGTPEKAITELGTNAPQSTSVHEARHTGPTVWAHGGEVRALATQGDFVWAATNGGLVRYDQKARERVVFDATTGLDSIDVRGVRVVAGELIVDTAESACKLDNDQQRRHFVCVAQIAVAANAPTGPIFRDDHATARAVVTAGTFIGTRDSGVWFLSNGEPSSAVRLDPAEKQAPRSFVKKAVSYKGHLWLGTFADGVWRASADDVTSAEDAHAPFRMVNDMLVSGDTMFVAANEGLFFTRDTRTWTRVDLVGAQGVTGLAMLAKEPGMLYATSTAALWKVRIDQKIVHAHTSWWRPAGTKSLQAISSSGASLYLASEDRGLIRFDGSRFTANDKLSGLPTSWAVDVAGDGVGGAFMATLRDGVMHVNGDGTWSKVQGLPGEWISSVSMQDGVLCVGTQSGAQCDAHTFAALPDPRAHAIVKVGDGWLIGTEAGTALYSRANVRS